MFRALHAGTELAGAKFRPQWNQACHASSIKQWKDMLPQSWRQGRWFSGEGEGKGGGSGGSIRSAGGSFGKMEVAHEEKFFREEQDRQVRELKVVMKETLKAKLVYHELQLSVHHDGIRRHKEQLAKDNNLELHKFHISQHEDALKHEQAEVDKIRDNWKRLRLD